MKDEEMYKIKRTINYAGGATYMLVKADLVGFTEEKNKKILRINEEKYEQIKELIERIAEALGGFK